MKIGLIVGTRPEIIKVSPLMRYCEKNNHDYFIIHSNQHYSANMDTIFFEELKLPLPKYNLNIGSASHGNQTGNIMIKIEPILEKEKPDVILVQGDTNTVLASALAATKMNIKVGHVEAGLRSYNRMMPEETNRIVTDHISDYLFVPTVLQKNILLSEGIPTEKIFVVGNTITDAVLHNIALAEESVDILSKLQLQAKKYILITAHRSLNVDHEENLKQMVDSFTNLMTHFSEYEFVYPIHPRTKKMMEQFSLHFPDNIKLIEPLGYFEFLQLQKNAKLVITDSGGLQEEACILGVPCVTIRDNTERPETISVGSNILSTLEYSDLSKKVQLMINKETSWKNPFGDGTSAKQIIDILHEV